MTVVARRSPHVGRAAVLVAALTAATVGCRPSAPPPAAGEAAILRAGWDAVDAGDAAGAREAVRALRAAGEGERAALLQARLLVARGFAAAALDILAEERKVNRGGGDGEIGRLARLVRGEIAFKARRYPLAERELAEVLAGDPESVDAHRLLAAMYYDAGVIPQAIRHLEETARLAPADHRPSRLLGLIHSDYERYDDAVDHYAESLRRSPDQADRDDVLVELAACEVRLRRHREALATLGRLAARSPASAALEAECLLAIGDRDGARAIVDRLLAAGPDDLGALVLDGTIRLEDGDPAAAVAPLERACASHPHDYVAHLRLAQALAGAGRDADATAARDAAEAIRALRREFADLHQAAWDAPGDAAVRRKLAATAAALGRADLERVWLDAADAIEAARE